MFCRYLMSIFICKTVVHITRHKNKRLYRTKLELWNKKSKTFELNTFFIFTTSIQFIHPQCLSVKVSKYCVENHLNSFVGL